MHGFPSRFLVRVLAAVLAVAGFASPAAAQTATLSTDVGNVPVAGSSSYAQSPGTYQLSGTGSGLGSSADAFHFAYYQSVLGDGQIVVRLASADPSAQAALVLRESLDAGAADAAVVVQNGSAQFVRRTATGNNAVADGTAGATVPCWLKLVRSGPTVSVFLSPDEQTWTSLGSDTVSFASASLNVGLAVSDGASGATNLMATSFDNLQSTFLPGTGLLTWLKADAGVSADLTTGAVSVWADQSGNGNDATQANAGNRPVQVAAAANGLPVVRFGGSGERLNLPSALGTANNFTFYVVARPTAAETIDGESTGGYTGIYNTHLWVLDGYPDSQGAGVKLSLGTNGVSVFEYAPDYIPALDVLPMDLSSGLSMVGVEYQNKQSTLYVDGFASQTGLTSSQPQVHGPNAIGSGDYGSFQGDVAEVLVYDHSLSSGERAGVEAYLNTRYAIVSSPVAPTNLSAAAISSTQANVLWTAAPEAAGYSLERKNATAPDSTYVQIATLPGGEVQAFLDSALSPGAGYTYRLRAYNAAGYSGYSTVGSVTLPTSGTSVLPTDNLLLWLKPDAGTTSDGSGLLSAWTDASGNGNNASAPAGNQPLLVTGALNGEPVVRFNGGNSFLQLPAGFSDFTQGMTALIVTRPASNASWQRFFDLGNGTPSDNLLLARNSTSNDLIYDGFVGGGLSTSVDAPNVLQTAAFQLLEVVHGVTGTAKLYNDASQVAQGSASPLNVVTRTSNFIGRSNWGDPLFQGDIAEVVMFNRALTDAERQAWETYLNAKYQCVPPPAAPAGLTVTALSATQVALSWADSSLGITGYLVERQNGDGTWSVVATLGSGATSYVDSGLVAGSPYAYRVTALGVASNSTATPASGSTVASSPGVFPTSGVRLWFRADAGVTTDTNGLVSAWADESGNGYDLAQGNAGNRPALVPNAYNGEPALHFDGSSTSLVSNSAFDLLAGSNDVSVIVVTNPGASQPTYADLFDYDHTNIGFVYEQNGNQLNDFSPGFAPVQLQAGQVCVSSLVKGGTDCQVFYNGQMVSDGNAPATLNPAPPRSFLIGNWYQGGRNYNGDIAELMIFNRALTAAERQTVESYLNDKYALLAPPGAPTSLAGTAVSSSQASLTWQPATTGSVITNYSVERKTTQGGDDFMEVAAAVPGPSSAYLDENLSAATSYTYRVRAYNAYGYSDYSPETVVSIPAAGGTLPASLPGISDLALWLKPDAGVTKDDNDLVSAWTDLSGQGNDALQTNPSSRPQWVDGVMNGLPVLRFDGHTDSLATRLPVNTTNGNATILAVVRLPDANTRGAFVKNGFYAGFGFGVGSGTLDSTGNEAVGIFDYACWLPTGMPWGVGPVLAEMSLDAGGNPTLYRNGSPLGNLGSGGPVPSTGPTYIGGYQHDNARFLRGDMAEVVMFNRALTDAERQVWETYLNAKYQYNPPPPAPGALTVTPLSSTQVALSWSENFANVASYTVERQNPDGTWSVIATLGGNATSYIDSGLTPGAVYSYRMTATNAVGSSPTVTAGGSTAASSPGLFPTTGMSLWLKADTGVSADANGAVSTWTDQAGGYVASQNNAASQPLLISGDINGLPALRFDGVDDYFDTNFVEQGGQGLTFVVVTKGTQYQSFLRFQPNNSGNYLIYPWSSPQLFIDSADGGTGAGLYCGLVSGQWNIGEVTYLAGGQIATYHNGSLVASRAAANTSLPAGLPLDIGRYDGGTEYLQADVAEVLIFNRALSDAERQTVESYLNGKYAIVNVSAAPANLIVSAISTSQANLFWTASPQAEGYSIERKDAAADDGAYVEVATIAGGEVQASIDSALTSGASYAYRLRAYNLAGYSGYSTPTTVSLPSAGASSLPTDDLLLWLKPDAGVSADAITGLVSSWTDASGNGNNASAPAGNQPTLVAGALNGQPVIRFDGSSSYLQLPSGFSDFTQGITALVVTKPATVTNYGRLYDLANGPGQQNLDFTRNATSNGLEMFSQNTRFLLDSSTGFALNQYQLAECEQDPTIQQATIYQNGVVMATGAAGPIVNTTRTSNFIARSNYGDPLYQGDIAEVVLFNHALSDADRQAWELYLNAKYNYDPVPPVPTQVVATPVSSTQAALGWLDTYQNISGYLVEQQNADGSWTTVATLAPTSNSYFVTGLAPGTAYTFQVIAVNRTGDSVAAQATLTTPASDVVSLPLDGLQLWLGADSGPVAGANGAVSQWLDRSGNGFTALPGGGQPTVVAGVLNGKPVVHFDGSQGQYFNLPDIFGAATATAGELVVVLRSTAAPGTINGLGRFAANGYAETYPSSDGNVYSNFSSTVQYGEGAPAPDLGQFNIYDVSSQPNLWQSWMDGVPLYQNTANTPSFYSIPTLGWYSWHYDYFFTGDVAEVLAYDRVLTADERQSLNAYLTQKYQLLPAPATPTGLSVEQLSPTENLVTWDGVVNNAPTSYVIERASSPDGPFTTIATVVGGGTYLDTTAVAGQTYYYQVYAQNAGGQSATTAAVAVVNPQANGQGVPTAGLQMWLMGDGAWESPVSNWHDYSGNGHDASQNGGSTRQPTVVAGVLNGKPVVHFDGSQGQYFNLPDIFGAATATAGELVVVLRSTAAPGTINGLGRFAANGYAETYPSSDGNVYSNFSSTVQYGEGAPAPDLGQFNIYDVSSQPNLWQSWMDGVPLYQNTANTPSFYSIPTLGWYSWHYDYFFTGDVAEVLAYDRVLTADERQSLNAYLTQKYQLLPAPATPTGFQVITLSQTQNLVSWDATPGDNPVDYTILRASSPDGPYTAIATVVGGSGTYLDDTVVPGQTYYYEVYAQNGAGSSGTTAAVTVLNPQAEVQSLPLEGLQLWLMGDGAWESPLSYWHDYSGNGHDAVQNSGSTQQPTVVPGALNGKPVVHFDGTQGQYLNLPSAFGDTPATAGELILVLRNTAPAGTTNALGRFGVNGPADLYPGGDGNVYSSFGTDTRYGEGVPVANEGVPAADLAQFNVYDVSSQSGLWQSWMNEVPFFQNLNNVVDFALNPTLGWFSWQYNYYFTGDVAEVLAYNRVLSPTERHTITWYLAAKYLLPNYDLDGDGLTTAQKLAQGLSPFNSLDNNGLTDTTNLQLGLNPQAPGFNYATPPNPNGSGNTPPAANPNDHTPPVITLTAPANAVPLP